MAEIFSDARLGEDLLWRDLRVESFPQPVPALFLDRDGVIIEEKRYISDPGHVEILPGIAELIGAARALGMSIVEITNQAGIARGYFGWPEFVRVENRVADLLKDQGASIDAVFACPFHPQGQQPYRKPDHPWRKPNAGMLAEAARLLNLALSQSVLVGDKVTDLQAARATGLALGVHVLTGHGQKYETESRALASPDFHVRVVRRADEAVEDLRRMSQFARPGAERTV